MSILGIFNCKLFSDYLSNLSVFEAQCVTISLYLCKDSYQDSNLYCLIIWAENYEY